MMKFPILSDFCALVLIQLVYGSSAVLQGHPHIKVFHYILKQWTDPGAFLSDSFSCHKHIKCEWKVSDDLELLRNDYLKSTQRFSNWSNPLVSVGLHNIHSIWQVYKDFHPQTCMLPTNLSMWETEEPAYETYKPLFRNAQPVFDGYSSTSPNATVQRIFSSAKLNSSSFLSLTPFSNLIKAGAYIASDCHERDGTNSHRDELVQRLRNLDFRVDGLGRCMHTDLIPEGIYLNKPTDDAVADMKEKRKVISHYAFTMAFENMLEDGYVSEKPFDALLAGKRMFCGLYFFLFF
jgi:hypothetical protein